MAPLAARRLAEMVELGARVVVDRAAARRPGLRSPRRAARRRHGAAARHPSGASSRSSPKGIRCPTCEPLVGSAPGRIGCLTLTAVDIHQHLWPPAFIDALAARPSPRCSTATCSTSPKGASRSTSRDHELETRLASLDAHGIDVAVVSLQPTLGLEAARPGRARRARRRLGGRDRSSWSPRPRAASCRSRAGPRDRLRRRLRGRAAALATSTTLAPVARRAARHGGFLFVHPVAGGRTPAAPDWWPALADYTAQMQTAYLAWLARGQERWPDVPVVFAILAGGGPFQLERLALARRRRPLRAPPERLLRHRLLRAASARAVHPDLRRRAARLRQRRARRRPAADASGRKGIRRICRTSHHVVDNPTRLLP